MGRRAKTRVPTMAAKEPVAAREDESAPHLRGRAPTGSASKAPHGSSVHDNVVALPLRDAERERLEAHLRDAFERGLQGPATAAKSNAAVLAEQLSGTQSDRAREILAELDGVEGALADLLEFLVSGAAGGLRVARRRVDLKLLCERVLDSIQAAYPENMIAFACDAPVEGQWDPESIASLVSRLVINAIQHGNAKRTIGVSLTDLDDYVSLVVTNEGPSLDDTIAWSAFQPFGGRRSKGAGRKGLGLGLFLSREIVRAHGGRIEARCGDGKVAVKVTLPRAWAWIQR